MTREEAYENYLVDAECKPFSMRKFLDEIYDDFESRTCENCKHSYGNHPNTKACNKIHGWISKNFGCNKFERKE